MKYRNEWKYLVSDNDLNLLENKLSKILQIDSHAKNGMYIIHSLYFDDFKNTCIFDNDAGLSKRYKWRIRYYDADESYITLERKEKLNGMCGKKKCIISLETFRRIMNNEAEKIFWETDNNLMKKFCIDILTRGFRPKVIIDYERVAYVEPITNIRITFDRNISCSNSVENFLERNYTKYPVNLKDRHVLEVKFDDILPGHLKRILNLGGYQQTSYSKYYLGRRTLERG